MVVLLDPLVTTESGRPKLLQGEVEHIFLDKADLQFEEEGGVQGCITKNHEDGFAILTTHRLIWVDAARAPAPGASCFVYLSTVESVQLRASHAWRSPKLRVRIHLDHQGRPTTGLSTHIAELRLVSRNYGNLAEQAQNLLARRIWERSHAGAMARPAIPVQAPQGNSSPPGVSEGLVQQLAAMGFPHNRTVRACLATNSAGVESALQWLFSNENTPGIDQPLPGVHAPDSTAGAPRASFSTATAGIAGILRREEELAARTDRTMEQAFQDLRGLMAKAQEMVLLAEKFRGALAGKGETVEEEALDSDMQQQLIEIGIASPVTKEAAGALYHQQLSRQLAGFLSPRMERAGGLMTLADVYCLFNRARGTELISPDDLLQAVSLFGSTGAPMHLRTFSSGVLVVQSNSHDDDHVCARIAELVGKEGVGPPISATDVATALAVPLTIASQHLATAETRAVLCRDDGPEGLRFFRNFFADIPVQ